MIGMIALQLVRPNLGQPIMLHPDNLQNFQITVAGQGGGQMPSSQEVEATLKSFQLRLRWRAGKPAGTQQEPGYDLTLKALHAGNNLSRNLQGLPVTSEDYQSIAGYQWTFDVTVGINDPTAIQKLRGSPKLLDFVFGDQTNYQSIYVDERLKDLQNFTLIHVTDPHVARRNDHIPEILAEMRTFEEFRNLMLRYINYNDNLRAAIRYANKKKRAGELVIMVITGDLVDYFHDRSPQFDDPETSNILLAPGVDNFEILRDLLTGRDGRGEPLECPVFTILGNHDYLEREIPMRSDVTVDCVFWLEHVKTLSYYSNFGLTANEGAEYDYWADGCPILDPLSPFGPRRCREGVKNGFDYHKNISRDTAYEYTKPHMNLLGTYLRLINFDTDFSLALGIHRMLFLNTAEDIVPPRWYVDLDEYKYRMHQLENENAKGNSFSDFMSDGTHNRGISEQHLTMVKHALRESTDSSILFCFTHAPLLNLQRHWTEGRELLYEERCNAMTPPPPPNQISMMLYRMLKDIPFIGKSIDTLEEFRKKYEDIDEFAAKLKNEGFAQGGTSYLKKGEGYSLWVSAGHTDDLGAHRQPYPSSLPPGKKPEDIVGFAISGYDKYNYVWFKDGTYCAGTSDDLDSHRPLYRYTLPPGKRADDIVGIAKAGSDNHTYVWFKDGTYCFGNSDDLDCHHALDHYSLAPDKKPEDIVGIAMAKSDDHTYVWFKDGTCCSGTNKDLDCHRPLYFTSLPAKLGATAANIIDMDIANDGFVYVLYLVPSNMGTINRQVMLIPTFLFLSSPVHSYAGTRGWLSFGCAEGKVDDFFQLADKPELADSSLKHRPFIVLSGHTHNVHEFRIKAAPQGGMLEFYTDDYAADLQQQTGNRRPWLEQHTPLFLTSGDMKGTAPEFREIVMRQNTVDSITMKTLQRPWYSSSLLRLWVSAGKTDDLDAHRHPYPSFLPPGKKPEDIVGFAIAGSDDHNYVWFKDYTCCAGTSDDLDRYRQLYRYTLPLGKRPEDIVGMAMAGSDDHTYVWFKDGTCCSGTSDDLDCHRSLYNYTLPPGKKPEDIVGIAMAKSDDHTYVWFKDGTCSSGTSDDLDRYRSLYKTSLPPELGITPGNIIDMDMASDDHTYVWYLVQDYKAALSKLKLWVSAGRTDDLGAYRQAYPSSLPPGKKPEDIVGFAIAGSDDHNYVWFKDYTCCAGTSDDLDRYRQLYRYTLPTGKRPEDIVGMAMAGSDDHTYVWFKDGTCCSGTSDDLDRHRSLYNYTLPPGKKPEDIVGIAMAKSDDHTYVWFKDGTCSSGTSDDLDCYRELYNSSLPAGLNVQFTDILDMDMASDDHTYVLYLMPPR